MTANRTSAPTQRRPKRPGKAKTDYELVSPEEAKALLGEQEHNRSKAPARVTALARSMASGDWHPDAAEIQIGTNGRLMNGQHRLDAVVLHGKAVWMRVTRDVDPAARVSIDTGRSRSTRDVMGLLGVPNATNATVSIKAYMRWEIGNPASTHFTPTAAEVHDFYVLNADLVQEAVHLGARVQGKPLLWAPYASGGVALGCLMNRWRHEDLWLFYDSVRHGDRLDRRDPRLVLRNWLIRSATSNRKPPSYVIMAVAAKALDRFARGEEAQTLSWKSEVEEFPGIPKPPSRALIKELTV